MIKYSLICARKHRFDSWFASASAFDTLCKSGMVSCAICGSTEVTKAIMAPSVQAGDARPPREEQPKEHPLTAPASPAEQALAELRKRVEQTSDYVGREFAREARAIHTGDAPKRSIHGEANLKEARELIEDGVPVMPLPLSTGRKSN